MTIMSAREARALSLRKGAFDNAKEILPRIGTTIKAAAELGMSSVDYHLQDPLWFGRGFTGHEVVPSDSALALKETLEKLLYMVQWKTRYNLRAEMRDGIVLNDTELYLLAVISWDF